jgi:hypothetical protein
MAWNNFNYWNGPPYHDNYLTYPVVQQIRPCVRLDEGNYAHIIWEDNRAGVQRLAFRRSSNILSSGGPWPLTWNSLVYVDDTGHNTKGNTTGYVQGHSQIVVTGSGASAINYAVWVSSDNNIYFDKSTNGGAAWGTDVRVNDNTAATREWPSLSLDGSDNIYVVWMDNRDGNSNIYFSYSTDGGNTFSPDTCVHNATPEDKYPGITAGAETDALSEVHIAWTRVDTTLYSKGSPVPVGITEIDFTASCCKDGIVLKWTTRGQIHGAAWILYRSESKNHGYFEIDRGPVNPREKRHTYTDKNVICGTLYFYRLNLLNEDGTIGHTRTVSIIPTSQGKNMYLKVASNPSKHVFFNYNVDFEANNLSLQIFDSQGRMIKSFAREELTGATRIGWDGRINNDVCPSGIYFAILSNDANKKTAKFVLLK